MYSNNLTLVNTNILLLFASLEANPKPLIRSVELYP